MNFAVKTAVPVAALAMVLTACSSGDPKTPDSEFNLKLNDGRTVHCVRWDRGISCDWEHAR